MSSGFTLWFTGLPCSGKTTLAEAVGRQLEERGRRVEHLDGDIVRKNLSSDLGFSKLDRKRNISRVAFVASLLSRNGVAVIVALVSPYRSMRREARRQIENFVEVYVNCPLKVCQKRDVKGMYRLARAGKIAHFTGVSDPYEAPLKAEVVVNTSRENVTQSARNVIRYLENKKFLLSANPFPESPLLTKAFSLASHHHKSQVRKGGGPFIEHPIAVARMLRDAGYQEPVVAAGLLHDVLEDTGCEAEEIEREVGAEVARIVYQVTEKDKTLSWTERKSSYLLGLESASREALAVSCADKIHNMESLVHGYQKNGAAFASKFSTRMTAKIENFVEIEKAIAAREPRLKLLSQYRKALRRAKSHFVHGRA